MVITIDAGNTSTKLAYFENGKIVKSLTLDDDKKLFTLINSDKEISGIICSVNRSEEFFSELLVANPSLRYLSSHTRVPVNIHYDTPETLGMDRLAGVTGAKYLYPGEDCLVIDAGTCITYDFIDSKNNYYGGAISPGISIRFKSLHSLTARLPEIKHSVDKMDSEINLIGKNTKESILSGVLNGVTAEVEGIINKYKKEFHEDIKVILCGGDAHFFESKIKPSIFAIPQLVHWGLYRIVKYNESEI